MKPETGGTAGNRWSHAPCANRASNGGWSSGCTWGSTCDPLGGDALQVFFLLPTVHEEEGLAEPQNQDTRSPEAPCQSHLGQVIPVLCETAAEQGFQAPRREAICVRGLQTPGIEPKFPEDAHHDLARTGGRVCELCSPAFTQKANLNIHLSTHTGEKPFQDHLCGRQQHPSQPGHAQPHPNQRETLLP